MTIPLGTIQINHISILVSYNYVSYLILRTWLHTYIRNYGGIDEIFTLRIIQKNKYRNFLYFNFLNEEYFFYKNIKLF